MIAEALVAAALAAAPPVVHSGDRIFVQGTQIMCSILNLARRRQLECFLYDDKGIVPKSYGTIFNDDFAVVVAVDTKRQPQLVVRQPQPAAKDGTAAPLAKKPAARTLVVQPGAVFQLEGNKTRCIVAGTQRILVCYLPAASGQPAARSYEVGIGSSTVQLAQADTKGNAKLLLVRVHGK